MIRTLRNRSEAVVQRQIREALPRHGAELFEKIRIADVVDIKRLGTRSLGTYALQAHFDFVVVDEDLRPALLIEFDGPGHNPTRDADKDAICLQAGLPLFRVFGFHEVRDVTQMTLVRYLVDLVFYGREFLRMREQGEVGHDEPFMMSGFIRDVATSIWDSEFGFVFHANTRLTKEIRRLGLTASEVPPHLTIQQIELLGPDGDDFRVFCSMLTNKGQIAGKGRLRVRLASRGFLDNLGFVEREIAEFGFGMAADDLTENLRLVASGAGHVVPALDEIMAEIDALVAQGYMLIGGSSGSEVGIEMMSRVKLGCGSTTAKRSDE